MVDASVIVVAAIIVDGRRVLVARRGATMSLAGKWEFPGGKVEANETHQSALVREIQEEFRATIAVGAFVASSTYDYGAGRIVLRAY